MKNKMLVFLLALTVLLSSCGAYDNTKDSAKIEVIECTEVNETKRGGINAPKARYGDVLENAEIADDVVDGAMDDADKADSDPLAERKIIKVGMVRLETTEYDKSLEALRTLIKDFGGYIHSSDEYDGRDDELGRRRRHAYIQVKVPAEKFDAFLTASGNVADLINKSEDKQDVTSRYTDIELRLKTLKIKEERLLALLEKADEMETIISLENALSSTRYEIESYETSRRNLDDKISYSTINIELKEVRMAKEYKDKPISLGEKISYAFSNSLRNTGIFLENLLLAVVSSLPLILFVCIIIIIVVSIFKKRKKNRIKKSEEKSGNIEDKKEAKKED